MKTLIFLALLVGQAATVGAQQKVLEQRVALAPGQRLRLSLKQATSIHLRAGSGREAVLRATVAVNGGQLNDAFLLSTSRDAAGATITSALDEALTRTSTAPACPDGAQTWGGNWRNGRGSGYVCLKADVEVTVPAGVAVEVTTISADIEARGLTVPLDLKSISGFVDVSWPAQQAADVAFKTISGEVYTDQDVVFLNRKENPLVGYQVRGTLAGGGSTAVRLESISGNVFFRRQ